jgi:shikimate dehydrogenase
VFDSYSGATRVLYIVGDPIAQVKSPHGITAALRDRGADAIVVPAQVRPADLGLFVELARRQVNCDGVIVTVPHKFDAAALCEGLTPRARSIGAVNVMRRTPQGGWWGDMCDGEGYVAGLRRAGCEPRGRRALLIGAGGAGSAIAHALVDARVASLDLHDHDATRRDGLVAKLRAYGPVAPGLGTPDPAGHDLVLNASPAGMRPDDPLPVEVTRLAAGTFVGDVVTVPAETALLTAARARGLSTMSGIGMFDAVSERIVDFYLGDGTAR